jgi:hypothetical protein
MNPRDVLIWQKQTKMNNTTAWHVVSQSSAILPDIVAIKRGTHMHLFHNFFLFNNMSTTLNELLGDQLLQHNEVGKESNQISTNQLNGKTVALYFSFVYSQMIEIHISCFSFF